MIGGKYFTLLIILFLNLFVISVQGLRINFLGELLVFVLFAIASLIILTSELKSKPNGVFSSIFFALSLINLFYIKHALSIHPKINVGTLGWLLFGLTLFLNAVGFLMSTSSIKKGEYSMTRSEKEAIIEKEIIPKIKEMEAKLEKEISLSKSKPQSKSPKYETQFYPGKFLASKNGSVYHTAKCDWAKKISGRNQAWFQTKEEAKKAGYKQHDCVKKK